jgi:hypothetical protein
MFESFPRGDLPVLITRREFFRSLLTEFQVGIRKAGGAEVYRIAGLGSLPDEELALLAPVILPDSHVSIREGSVWTCPPGGEALRLFELDSPALFVFNHFNGQDTLGETAARLTEREGWPPERAFAYTRGVFLTLVQQGVSLPREALPG